MIHDLIDLEPLLHQYDHEKILVGPLLNLWTNSRFRVFNIAGKSGKIHETIGLGFFELELDAQRRRADIVTALKDCFGEVQIFNSQLEMAQMAHTLWANDETARFLETVSWESKPRPISETSQKQELADPNDVTVSSGDRDIESGEEGACIAVPPRNAMDTATLAPQLAREKAQPTLARDPTQISEPSYPRLSAADAFANPGTLAESGSYLEAIGDLPATAAGSSVSKKHRVLVVSGVTAYLAICFVVGFLIGTMVFTSLSSKRPSANEAKVSGNAAASITAGNDPSPTTRTGTDAIPASPIGTANREAEPSEAVRATSPALPTSQPGVANGQADVTAAAAASRPQNPSDQAGAVATDHSSQSSKAQDNQADDSTSLPQPAPQQTVKTQSSAAETVPLSIPQPLEVAPTQVFVSPASTQIIASHDERQLLPSETAASELPEALSPVPQRQAFISAIIPLPRPRPVVNAVSTSHPHRREEARSPIYSLFGH